jgi:hypothetical protein
LLLAACASPGPDATTPVLIRLNGVGNNSGETGQAALVPVKDRTQINLTLSGVPPMTTRPVHVYTYIYEGSCSKLPEKPAYELNDRVLVSSSAGTGRPPFTLSHTVPAPMEQLLGGRFALALRNAPADGSWLIYCAELRRS